MNYIKISKAAFIRNLTDFPSWFIGITHAEKAKETELIKCLDNISSYRRDGNRYSRKGTAHSYGVKFDDDCRLLLDQKGNYEFFITITDKGSILTAHHHSDISGALADKFIYYAI